MTLRGELLEAKMRHKRALGRSMHVSEKITAGFVVLPKREKLARTEVLMAEKLSDNVRARLAECLRLGMHPSAAAQGMGIARETLERWVGNGKRDAELELATPYAKLYTALAAATAEAEETALRNLQTAAEEPKHWMANAWFLERRFPKRWGKQTQTQITGPDGGPVKHQVAVLMVSPEKLSAAMALTEGKNNQIIEVSTDHDEGGIDADLLLAGASE